MIAELGYIRRMNIKVSFLIGLFTNTAFASPHGSSEPRSITPVRTHFSEAFLDLVPQNKTAECLASLLDGDLISIENAGLAGKISRSPEGIQYSLSETDYVLQQSKSLESHRNKNWLLYRIQEEKASPMIQYRENSHPQTGEKRQVPLETPETRANEDRKLLSVTDPESVLKSLRDDIIRALIAAPQEKLDKGKLKTLQEKPMLRLPESVAVACFESFGNKGVIPEAYIDELASQRDNFQKPKSSKAKN